MKYSEPLEGDNGSGTGLVSRARIPLALNPRKKGFTRIPPTLADTTSRPAGHASRRRTHWRNEQGADARNKTHKKKSTKNMKDNQQKYLKGTSQSLHYTTQRTHARLFLERGAAFLPSFPHPSAEYEFEFEFAFNGLATSGVCLITRGRLTVNMCQVLSSDDGKGPKPEHTRKRSRIRMNLGARCAARPGLALLGCLIRRIKN